MKVIADKKIPGLSDFLSKQLDLELLSLEDINAQALKNADILIGRSVLKVNEALLDNTSVRIVATCSSGTDHIDVNYLNERGIKLFSAPGSNAQAVTDYILWMVAYVQSQGKKFAKKAGIIGAGYVGSKVKLLLETLGFQVIVNDPPRALRDPTFVSAELNEIAECDLICLHPSLSVEQPYPSYHLLSTAWWQKVKEHTVIINASRGAVIDTQALLAQNKKFILCCDVFENEPHVNQALIENCLIATPHIAGHTIESFYRATQMIVNQIHDKLGIVEKNSPCPPFCQGETGTIDASSCRHWYDVILKCYNFRSKVDLTPTSFYTLRETHRIRQDFATMTIKNSYFLSESDRTILIRLQLKLED